MQKDTSSPARRIEIFLLAALLLITANCATNPVTRQPDFVLLSEDQEIAIGREMNPKILKEYGDYPSEQFQNYVASVGKRLADASDRIDLFFHFRVVNSPEVNAFALPGGCAKLAQQFGFHETAGSAEPINGLDAYVSTYEGRSERPGDINARIGFIRAEDRVHYVIGYTRPADFAAAIPLFNAAIRSFRQLTTSQAQAIKPSRIRLHTVTPGETIAVLCRESGRTPAEAKKLALINGLEPKRAELKPGVVIKVIKND